MQIETDIERTHEDRQRGRFLKKNGSIYQKCQITEYSFEEIAELQITYPDNRQKNILHKRFHEESDFSRTLNEKPIDDNFVEKNLRDLIITPRDFTTDWHEARQKARRRNSKKFEDEDDFEMSLEEEEASKREKIKSKKSKEFEDEKKQKEVADLNKKESYELENDSQTSISENNLEAENDPLKDLQNTSFFEKSPLSITDEESFENNNIAEDLKLKPETNLAEEKNNNDDFKVLDALDDKIDLKINNEEDLKKSYELGYQKALDENKEKMDLTLKNIASIIEAFNSKKKEILSKTKSNFEDLVSIITESIIGKKLKKDTALFEEIIKKAVSEGMKEENYKIYVSEEIFENLKSYDENFTLKYVQKDPNIKDSDFRVESQQSVIESSIKDIVNEAIKKADINLFEDE